MNHYVCIVHCHPLGIVESYNVNWLFSSVNPGKFFNRVCYRLYLRRRIALTYYKIMTKSCAAKQNKTAFYNFLLCI